MPCHIFETRQSKIWTTARRVFDPLITTGEVIALPLSLMVAGYARHDTYQVSTALLAGEAYADVAVVDLAIKAVTRRKRPSDVAPGASYHDTFFAGGKSPFKGSSFPSGHAAGVFAVATVWPAAIGTTSGCHGLPMGLPPRSACRV